MSDEQDNIPQAHVSKTRVWGIVAITLGIAAHILIILFSLDLFAIPAGTHVRAMHWAYAVFMISTGAFFAVEPISIIAVIWGKPRTLGIIGMALGFTTFLFCAFILYLAAAVKGFVLAE
ncbi:MAG: hypothetical protein HZA50_13485 [Planctomycetes bacterium]|nr:hypothetical protein [Planctomycetota bacterium]